MILHQFPRSNNNQVNSEESLVPLDACRRMEGAKGVSEYAPPRRPVGVQLEESSFEDEVPEKREHAADPIKSVEDIQLISTYLINCERYRDNLLFVAGINLGLRCGDLLTLKVGHLLSADGTSYRDCLTIREQKTNKIREAYLNDAIYDAADLYFAHAGKVKLDDYLFKSVCNRVKAAEKPITVRSAERLLKEIIIDKCGIQMHVGTHTLRKTFSYHILMNAPDRTRAVEFLQKILGHSSPRITLAYAGITDDEIKQSYQELNLGRHLPFQWSLRGNLSA